MSARASDEPAQLLASDAGLSDNFGTGAAIAGNRILVGSPNDDDGGSNAGSVYAFEFDGASWVEVQKFRAADTAASDGFGSSIGMDGTAAVIGAPEHGTGGAAYVFRFNGTIWVEEGKLVGSTTGANDDFGASVAIQGTRAVVGAPFNDDNSVDGGRAYVFSFDGVNWSEEALLDQLDTGFGDRFGSSVAIDGTAAIVGASRHDSTVNASGAAYVFRRSGTTWTQEDKLFDVGLAVSDNFGESVDIEGDVALIGVPSRDAHTPGNNGGAAFVFRNSAGSWSVEQELTGIALEDGDELGTSVALEGADALIGARDSDLGLFSGSAHLYRFDGTTWNGLYEIHSPVGSGTDRFAGAIGFDGAAAVFGARSDGEATAGAGAAYVFDVNCPCEAVETYCTGKTNSCGTVPEITFSGTPSATASSGFVITGTNTRTNKSGLVLYTPDGRASLPFQGGTLCIFPSLRRSVVVISTGGSGGASCDATFSIDWNAFVSGNLGGNPVAFTRAVGKNVNVQWWGRDSLANGSYLSNGLEYGVCP